jgi:hypothetical protein
VGDKPNAACILNKWHTMEQRGSIVCKRGKWLLSLFLSFFSKLFCCKNILSNKVFFYFVFTTGHGLMITHHRSVSCTTSLLKISSFLTMHQEPV